MFGPETHMTAICGMALGTRAIPQENNVEFATANFLLPSGEKQPNKKSLSSETNNVDAAIPAACSRKIQVIIKLFLVWFVSSCGVYNCFWRWFGLNFSSNFLLQLLTTHIVKFAL